MMRVSEETAMNDRSRSPFTDHLHDVNETYLQHMGHALSYAGRLAAAAFCALVHALLPFLFVKTASNLIREMYGEMSARGALRPEPGKTYPAE